MHSESVWARLARQLAEVEREDKRLTARRTELAVAREQLHTELRQMLEHVEPAGTEWTGRDLDVEDTGTRMRIPEWAAERRRQTVEPGHGASTAVIAPNSDTLSMLSTTVPCGHACNERQMHAHYADGKIVRWEQRRNIGR